MFKSIDKRDLYPLVTDFYDGKSVFITGAAGFLGEILLETLLHLCPGIQRIYILIRERRGLTPEIRKDQLFKKSIFDSLREDNPDALNKVEVVAGDVSKPDFGMNEEDLQKIIQNASIVFHCAASINFLKPLRYILEHNTLGTQHMIDICRKLKKLEAFVYTSTAYGNCNRTSEIDEIVYRLPFPAQRFLDEIKNGTEESLQQLMSECLPEYPNFYTFSKCLAENVIMDNASDLPIAIVRPSIVGSCWKRPLKGFVEENNGLTSLSQGVGKGFIKVIKADPEVKFDIVPVDVAASVHVFVPWSLATGRFTAPLVMNCSSFLICSLKEYSRIMMDVVKRYPLPKTFRKPTSLWILDNSFLYWILSAYEHYIPAFFMDIFLQLSGSKLRLVSIYQYVDQAILATNFFMTRYWTFKTENFKNIMQQLDPRDKEIFEVDTHICSSGLTLIAEDIPKGSAFWNWSIDKKSLPVRMRAATQRHWITIGIKAMVSILLFLFLYMVFLIIAGLFH